MRSRAALALVLLGASALLSASVRDDWFTPLFMLRAEAVPGAKWLVVLGAIAPIIMIARGRAGWAFSLSLMFAMANVVALPFNFFGAWAGSNWEGRTNAMAIRFWWFYVIQISLVLLSWLAVRQLPANERRYPEAAGVVGAWGMLFFVIAWLTASRYPQ